MSRKFVTQRDEFECTYLMPLDDEGHAVLRAHRYRVEFTVASKSTLTDGQDVLIDFDKLSNYIKYILPNRSFLYNRSAYGTSAENSIAAEYAKYKIPVVGYMFTPSAENLADHFARKLQEVFDSRFENIEVVEVKLRESTHSYATWKAN